MTQTKKKKKKKRAVVLGNFLYRGVLLIRIIVGQRFTVLAVSASEGAVWDIFSSLSYFFSFSNFLVDGSK